MSWRPKDPSRQSRSISAALQATEILPDSTNVGGSDGHEFIEVFDAMREPIGFEDHQLTTAFAVEVLSDREIGAQNDVASGAVAATE
ncbi:hypothetical protein [Microbacterium sp. G2-8]|uniref:hypothetical protein n=1 Tax=Microbacterium sp. G2-8 TaxID=2842454 RepID=UPI001C898CBE|nr:hypothetical protein [Microbacterium sp. G2-8]